MCMLWKRDGVGRCSRVDDAVGDERCRRYGGEKVREWTTQSETSGADDTETRGADDTEGRRFAS